MRIPALKNTIFLASFLCCLYLLSCNKTSKSESETTAGNYKMPETIPLKFTDPVPFEWETITNDTLLTPVTYPLNVDALPSKPFDLNQFRPLKTPMLVEDLDWDNLTTEELKMDSVPFTISESAINKPKITKMLLPSAMDGANASMLQLSIEEGLPHNEISSFVENDDGSLWIGSTVASVTFTNGNLTLYDGENASTYDYQGVQAMALDKMGKLWLATRQNGIVALDFQNNVEYKILPSEFTAFGTDVICDHNGMIYISAWGDGFLTIDPELKNLQKIAYIKNRAVRIFEDSQHNIWLGARDGLAVLNKEKQTITTIPVSGIDNRHTAVFDINEDKTGNIWVCLDSYARAVNIDNSKVVRISKEDQTLSTLSAANGYDISGHAIEEDRNGNYWIAGLDELFVLDRDLATYKKISTNNSVTPNNKRIGSLKRKDGTLWFGTIGRGVAIVNDFTLKTAYFNSTDGLMNNEVWEIEENSRGEIWLGTVAGINIIDPEKNTIRALNHQQLHHKRDFTINFCEEILEDIYLFRASSSGFSIYDRQKGTMTQYLSNSQSPLELSDFEMIDDHTFYLYGGAGLYLYDINARKLEKLTPKSRAGNIRNRFLAKMIFSGKETIWLASDNGLGKVDLENRTISFLREDMGLGDNNVSVVKISQEGEIWASTIRGVSILNLEQNTLTSLREENGLVPDEMYDLIEKDSIMYAASVNGLLSINKSFAKNNERGYTNFNEGYGFLVNDYLQGSSTFLQNGQFLAGVVNSEDEFKLLVMDSEPKPDSRLSTVHISKMLVMDEEVDFGSTTNSIKWDSIQEPYQLSGGLVLPYNQNSLSFSFSSGDVLNRDKLNFRYILEGEDEDWNFANKSTKTKNYYNLKPDRYTFKVSSRSVNMKWSAPDVISFRIIPPWWRTWFAYIFYGLFALMGIWSIVQFRSNQLKRKNRLLEEKVQSRTVKLQESIENLKTTQAQLVQSEKMASLGELTAGIAHEIQNPLNFVNNFSEVNAELIDELIEEIGEGNFDEVKELANDIKSNEEKIKHHGSRADSIVKGMLKHSRTSNSEKTPTNINAICDEYLRLAYHGLRAKDKSFNAKLETDFDESIGSISVVAQDISRVILNLITNAFQATSSEALAHEGNDYHPTVAVKTKKTNEWVEIYVSDNGSGIPDAIKDKIFQPFFTTKPTGQGTGLGLSLSYDIVKAHGGELTCTSKVGEGTEFIIKLPII